MIEPDKEGLAYSRNVRNGIMTLQQAIGEQGYDFESQLEEIAEANAKLDELGITLDCDPRRMSSTGQVQSAGATAGGDVPAKPAPDGEVVEDPPAEENA